MFQWYTISLRMGHKNNVKTVNNKHAREIECCLIYGARASYVPLVAMFVEGGV